MVIKRVPRVPKYIVNEWGEITVSVVVLAVHGTLARLGLGPARPLGHDDLVDAEDGGRRIHEDS